MKVLQMIGLILVPGLVLILLSFYVFFSLKKAWGKIGTQDENSASHSERAYKAFEFFFTVTIAIVGGIGYLRIDTWQKDASLARQAMVFLAALQYFATIFLIIAVTSHVGSKWERWRKPHTKTWIKKEWWRMVEPWMIVFAYAIGTSIWIIANKW